MLRLLLPVAVVVDDDDADPDDDDEFDDDTVDNAAECWRDGGPMTGWGEPR